MRWTAAIALAALAAALAAQADEAFDVSAYEKKALEMKGYVEARLERHWLDRDSAGYILAYPGETRDTANRSAAAAELSGVLRHQDLSFNFTGHANWIDEPRGSAHDGRMYEAYGAWQIDSSSKAELGKRALRWGTGYAWSPVAFLERTKDPIDPELSREGYVMAMGSFVQSFEGPLQTLALTALVLPTRSDVNTTFAAPGHTNPAIKLYGLLFDTDVDLIWAGPGSRGPRFGVDFSRNLGTNFEIHGEWAHTADARRVVLTPANGLATEAFSYSSALFGVRYLTERETTVIFELYRNGAGYSSNELAAFYDLVRASERNPALGQLAVRAAAQGFNRPNAAQHYVNLRVSQKEPFDILDFTPAATLIANSDDRSWSLIPEATYTGIKNLELRLRVALNRGNAGTEYGERAVRSRVELRARLYF